MAINFNRLNAESYNTLRQQMIEAIEGRNNVVYRDTVGIATIGIGLNLSVRSVAQDVINTNLVRNGSETKVTTDEVSTFLETSGRNFANNPSAQNAINAAWQTIANNHNITSTELYLDDEEMTNLFEVAAGSRETTLTQHFANNTQNSAGETVQASFSGDDYSYERLALFFIVYNGGEALLGNNLTTAINDGDRFRAWFEIRDDSNGGRSRNHGIAKRRFYEAELFGLFDNRDNPTIEEIRHIINTLNERVPTANNRGTATYLDKISKYENDFYVKKDNHGREIGPRHYFESMIEKIPEDYSDSPRADTKPYIGEVFRPLASELLAHFLPQDLSEEIRYVITQIIFDGQVIPGITDANSHITPRGYSSYENEQWNNGSKNNLLVAIAYERDNAGNPINQDGITVRSGKIINGNNDNDIMIGGDGANTMTGNGGNDTMIGGNKKDTMNGGDGNDTLIGRDGNDEINGGDGNDTFIGGKGKDTLKGGTGEDTYVFAFEDIDGDVISDPDGGGKIKIDQMLLGNLGKIEYGGGATWTEKRGDYSLTYKLLNHKPAKDGNSDTSVGDLQITVTQGGKSKSFTIKD